MSPLRLMIQPAAERAVNKMLHRQDMTAFHERLLTGQCPFCPAGAPALGELREKLAADLRQSTTD